MVSDGVTEAIWHFIGYLRLDLDYLRSRISYTDGPPLKAPDDYKAVLPNFDTDADLDPFDTANKPPPLMAWPDPLPNFGKALSAPGPTPPKSVSIPHSPDEDFVRPVGSGLSSSGGVAVHHHISVAYAPGGDQIELQIKQYNFMADDDRLVITEGTGVNALHKIDVGALEDMLSKSFDAIPPGLTPTTASDKALTEFIQARDADIAAGVEHPDEPSAKPGIYINGALTPPDATLPESVHKDMPENFGHGHGQWADLGSNLAYNIAALIDLTESGRSMIVGGSYFQTNALIQTNAFIDRDDISGTGGNHSSSLESGGNRADNIAELQQNPGVYTGVPAFFAGPNWNVKVVDGDFYDVRTAVQKNYLADNDLIVQQSAINHYEIHAGDNKMYNFFDMSGGSFKYDLIIVEGSYHGANLIYQHNILLDDDVVKSAAADSENSPQSIITGQNQLTNIGVFANYGGDHFQQISQPMQDFMAALSRGDTTLDWNFGHSIASSGGTFDVLYVKGDYYDINALWQINVVSDVDTLIQLMHGEPGGDASQTAITGNNQLTNEAIIVHVGPTDAYVGGQHYTDTVLVQANLVATDQDAVHYGDTQALIPEVIAFVGNADADCPPDQIAHPAAASSGGDVMGGVLH
ncbi:hypothetical protein [Terrarubrum flagellatum]|uniref:hypothetical protein n=1 Tax=Terrirubrum flagellatum TaxID=2895980 RepID=UPI003145460B